MPLFYFDLIDCGAVTVDRGGMELADASEAREMAIKGAREIMVLELAEGRLNLDCTFIILDENRSEIGRVPFIEAVSLSGLEALESNTRLLSRSGRG